MSRISERICGVLKLANSTKLSDKKVTLCVNYRLLLLSFFILRYRRELYFDALFCKNKYSCANKILKLFEFFSIFDLNTTSKNNNNLHSSEKIISIQLTIYKMELFSQGLILNALMYIVYTDLAFLH